jgi:hypothetical protein
VQQCPGCAYLVPADWTECRRCGEPLDTVTTTDDPPAPALARTGAPAAEPLATPVPVPAPPPPASWTAPPRPPLPQAPGGAAGPPPPSPYPEVRPPSAAAGLPGRDAAPPAGEAGLTAYWRPDPPLPPGSGGRTRVPTWARVVAAAGVLAVSWFGGNRLLGAVFTTPVPEGVAAYVDGTAATPYTNARYGYSVDLPGAPVEQAIPFSVMGRHFQLDMALTDGPDLAAGIIVVQLPPGVPVTPDDLLEGGVAGIATVPGAKVTGERSTVHDGHAALDVTVDVPEGQARLRVVVLGNRAYVAMVAATGGVGDAFERLVGSWRIGTGTPA